MKAIPFVTLAMWAGGAAAALALPGNGGWGVVGVALAVFVASVGANSTMLTLHEAAHRTLSKSPKRNDRLGVATGVLLLTPFSAYKYVHMSHHGMLGRPRDLEFWPYVDRSTPTWFRRFFAILELTVAPVVYGVIFARVVVLRLVSPTLVRRIYGEYALLALVWGPILAAVAYYGVWVEFALAYAVPLWLGANMQSWRRLTEHLGLTDERPEMMTRTVRARNPVEKLYSLIMMYENYHGPHHSKGRVDWQDLPRLTEGYYPEGSPQRALLYDSYLAAVPEMFRALRTPYIGPQWAEKPDAAG